ncbi:MAG: DUF503 domain-containing protein [Clostridium sp.]
MVVGSLYVKLYCPWVQSLKEKRMVVKSIVGKTSNKFNVSISEVDNQDIHKTIGIGIATVANDGSLVNSTLDNVLNFIEGNTEAEIVDSYIEIF